MKRQDLRRCRYASLLAAGGLLFSAEGNCLPENYFAGLGMSYGTSLANAMVSSLVSSVFTEASVFPVDGDSSDEETAAEDAATEAPDPEDTPPPFA